MPGHGTTDAGIPYSGLKALLAELERIEREKHYAYPKASD